MFWPKSLLMLHLYVYLCRLEMAPSLVCYLASGLSVIVLLYDIVERWNVPHTAGFHPTEAYSFLGFSFIFGFFDGLKKKDTSYLKMYFPAVRHMENSLLYNAAVY